MFTALDPTLAYERREEMARRVSSGRLDDALRAAQRRRKDRWPLRLVRMLRAPTGAYAARARAGDV